jgi:hypothetical protein
MLITLAIILGVIAYYLPADQGRSEMVEKNRERDRKSMLDVGILR